MAFIPEIRQRAPHGAQDVLHPILPRRNVRFVGSGNPMNHGQIARSELIEARRAVQELICGCVHWLGPAGLQFLSRRRLGADANGRWNRRGIGV